MQEAILRYVQVHQLQSEQQPVTGSTYSWKSSPAGFTSSSAEPTVSPTVTTTYTLTQTITATGCQNTNSVVVTVNVKPTATAGGSQTICQNGSATVSGASATPSGATIAWTSNGHGTITNASTVTPTYNAVAADAGTTVTLTMTVSNSPCTAATAKYSVIVNAIPTATVTSGTTTFCQGGSVVLSANTGTGYSYQWLNGTVAISGATSSSYTATASGSYKVIVTNSQ